MGADARALSWNFFLYSFSDFTKINIGGNICRRSKSDRFTTVAIELGGGWLAGSYRQLKLRFRASYRRFKRQ
jgi:hypothetical protein